MKAIDIPGKLQIPFANAAGGGFIRPIPVASQIGIQNGAASLTDGFPPLTFLPTGAGGVFPFGQDVNGILNEISAWSRWQAAGGPVVYDSVFQALVGGYPLGAIVQSAVTLGLLWLCTADDNVTNPDTGGGGWRSLGGGVNVQVFLTNATYTPTVGMRFAMVYLKAGGGGGATSTVLGYGGGGGEGQEGWKFVTAAMVGASKAVTIGAGGASQAPNSSASGTSGGTSSFGSIMTVLGATGAGSGNVGGQGGLGGDGGLGADWFMAGACGQTGADATGTVVNINSPGGGKGGGRFTFPTATPNSGGGGGGGNTTSASGAGGSGICAVVEFL